MILILEVLKELKDASGFMRSKLCDRIDIRHTPELVFEYDDSIEYGKRIEEVIEKILTFALENGFSIHNLEYSPIKGPEGNIEYLVHLQKTEEIGTLSDVDVDWKQIVENAFDALAK